MIFFVSLVDRQRHFTLWATGTVPFYHFRLFFSQWPWWSVFWLEWRVWSSEGLRHSHTVQLSPLSSISWELHCWVSLSLRTLTSVFSIQDVWWTLTGFPLQVQWPGNCLQGWKLERSEATPHLCCLSHYCPDVPCLETHCFLYFIYFCGVVSDRTLNPVSTILSWPRVEVTQIKIFKWLKIHLPQRGVIHNIVLLIVWTAFLFRIDNIN